MSDARGLLVDRQFEKGRGPVSIPTSPDQRRLVLLASAAMGARPAIRPVPGADEPDRRYASTSFPSCPRSLQQADLVAKGPLLARSGRL